MKRECHENSKSAGGGGRQQRPGLKRTENLAFCMICDRQVDLVTFELAAEILKINFKEISEFARAGWIHRLHNARGEIAVCAESVFDVLETRPTQMFDPDIFKTNPSSSNTIF